jgi:hypothetical protein
MMFLRFLHHVKSKDGYNQMRSDNSFFQLRNAVINGSGFLLYFFFSEAVTDFRKKP